MVTHLRLHQSGRSRPAVLKRATRHEGWFYSHLLSHAEAPRLLSLVEGTSCVWLFLERIRAEHPDFSTRHGVQQAFARVGELHWQRLGCRLPSPHSGSPSLPAPPFLPTLPEAADLLTTAIPDREELVRHLVCAAAELFTGPYTLLHGDLHRWNMLGRRLVDWERAGFAHPVWELALIDPAEPGWDAVPRGPLAEVALEAYHCSGPLSGLPAHEFRRLHALARLILAAAALRRHRARARQLPPGEPRQVVREHAQIEAERVRRLLERLDSLR